MANTLSAVRTGKRSIFDPRTKILLVILTIAIMMSGGGRLVLYLRWALTAVPFLLLLTGRRFRTAFIYAGVYTAAYFAQILLMPIASGAVNFLLVALGIVARFMPGIAMASYMVSTTTVRFSEPTFAVFQCGYHQRARILLRKHGHAGTGGALPCGKSGQ